MKHAYARIALLVSALAILICACEHKKPQIVVPVVGKNFGDYKVMRDQRILELKTNFPDLPSNALDAFESVPRALFVADLARHRAYEDQMLPIGSEQATLKLSDIAWLITQLKITPSESILEIGTGTGYMTAILARLAKMVYSIEINEYLSENARQMLERLSITNIKLKNGDGLQGWSRFAPFDVVIITAAVPEIPQELIDQLDANARIAAPIVEAIGKTPWHIYRLDENKNLVEFAKHNANIPNAIPGE